MKLLTSVLFGSFTSRGDDDVVDRLNYHYTVVLIFLCSMIATAKQYMGNPLHCYIPPQFTPSMEEYIESYCWVLNTYFVPLHKDIPDEATRLSKELNYYQWVPFILALEGAMFLFPAYLWRLLNWQGGLNIKYLVNLAKDAQSMELPQRKGTLATVAQNMEDVLLLQNFLHCAKPFSYRLCFPRALRGRSVTMLYIFSKTLYVVNAIGQFFILNALLRSYNPEDYLYGMQVLKDLFAGVEWRESGHFPRITLCDIEVKYMGNLNHYTVQCALVANIFNEKIFAFLWCWFSFIAFVNLCSLLYWLFNTIIAGQRKAYISKYLRLATKYDNAQSRCIPPGSESLFDDFIRNYLRVDGVFMVKMIAIHAGDVAAMEVTRVLWHRFRDCFSMETYVGPSYRSANDPEMGYDTGSLKDV